MALPPVHTATDYLWQFQRLLPRGRIWHRGWGTLQAQHLLTLMPTWARLDERASELITETFPCSVAAEMLPEWEATLGLPDCEPLDTIQQRQQAVCAKFSMRGGQSIAYFIELAAAYGYQITITQHSAFRVDINGAEDLLNDAVWDFVWTVTSTTETYIYFSTDLSHAEEPLVAWGNAQLECLINEYAPAHTIPMFEYVDPIAVWDGDTTVARWDMSTTEAIWDGLGIPP
jgi:uncharacterized protein YmfQ (DUF2313 family)